MKIIKSGYMGQSGMINLPKRFINKEFLVILIPKEELKSEELNVTK
jgi:hypothetical protein